MYRREFLEKEAILFIETPGASFQDTSFNFKVFATAKRVVLTDKAYLHYRIDNASSSVKSLSKVFCICDEYQAIWDFARSRNEVYSKLKHRIPQIQFGGYLWNLDRLTPRLQYQFYERLVKEFKAFAKDDLIREDYFDEAAWDKVTDILSNSDNYFCANYGPVQINNTFLAAFESNAIRGCDRVVKELLKNIHDTDELYLWSSVLDLTKIPSIQKIVEETPNVHFSNNEIVQSFSAQLNVEEVSGKELVVLYLGGPEWSSKKTSQLMKSVKSMLEAETNVSYINEAWALGKWPTDDLKKQDNPIWLSLLLFGYYSEENSVFSAERMPKWILGNNEPGHQIETKAYISCYKSLQRLYSLASARSGCDFLERQKVQLLFRALYDRFRSCYQTFMKIGARL